ncbi:MAG: response regulator [Eubacterium sp.]|nr:response regulator [Eubacterium sp.]
MNNFNEYERETISHIAYLAVLTLLGLLLMIVSYISGWQSYSIPLTIVLLIFCWIAHLFNIGDQSQRLIFYTIGTGIMLFFYGSHPMALTDVPIVICLIVISLSAKNDMKLAYFAIIPYPLLIIYHIFTGYIGFDTEQVVISRLFLGIVAIIASAILANSIFLNRINSEKEYMELKGELDNAMSNTEAFLANVSHELRTPINAINGISEIMLSNPLPDDLKQDAESIHYAGKRIYNQISNILDFSEVTTGNINVVPHEYEITSVVNDAYENIVWGDYGKNLEIILDIQPDIPITLFGDDLKIKKIISELLDNAIKFTTSGGVYLYVSKRDEKYGINLNVDVKDTGVGMSRKEIEAIYKGYYKKDTSADRTNGGMGIGLNIVHALTSSMDGFMSIVSNVGEGTHVHVSVPQRIRNRQPSIYIQETDKYNIGCYFNSDKYSRKEVAEYYREFIKHVKYGLNLKMASASSLIEFKEIIKYNALTHVFISEWEYEMDRRYFDELSKTTKIYIFVARGKSNSYKNENIIMIQKPVFIINALAILHEDFSGFDGRFANHSLPDYSRLKVLVVDDDSMNIMVAKGLLSMYGIDAFSASSGRMAIDKCMVENYDLIFMDHMMPGMDGVEAMKKIRKIRNGIYNDVPIIALSANAGSGARNMFAQQGFDDFIAKPIETSAMTRVLKKISGDLG